MSEDISTLYTKKKNKECGRHGYSMWKQSKETNILPSNYGMFLQKSRNRSK